MKKYLQPHFLLSLLALTGVSLTANANTENANSTETTVNEILKLDAGKTIVSRGTVQAQNIEDTRKLKRRSPVFTNDKIITGADSSTQIRMVDGGILSLQADSELAVVDYKFDEVNQDGKVRLNLIKGGLRTVTGALTASAKKYQMQTPVASIGVRGTHYEAEIVDGELFLAVWDGDIDVEVEAGDAPTSFSLGGSEEFAFANVKENGEVVLLNEVPNTFSSGHSKKFGPKKESQEKSDKEGSTSDDESNNSESDESAADEGIVDEGLGDATELSQAEADENPAIDTEQLSSNEEQADLNELTSISENNLNEEIPPTDTPIDFTPTDADVIAARAGTITFGQAESLGITSSGGEISNFDMSMKINFDTNRVPEGELSFDDDQGRWFAAFDGVIDQGNLEMNVNSAAHGNNVAQGSIDANFISEATQVTGKFFLNERDNDAVNANGEFILSENKK